MMVLETFTSEHDEPRMAWLPTSATASQEAASRAAPMVLHVRVVTGHGGGPEKTILNSPRFLRKLGYQSKLAYLHPPGDVGFNVLQQRGVTQGAEVLSVPDSGPLDLAVVWMLIRICRDENVAIWHGHDYKSNFLGLLVRRFWPMKLVTTLHGWTNLSGRVPLYVKIDKWSLRFYEAAISVSDDLMQHCRNLGLAKDRCHLIHNAIDTEEYIRTLSILEAKRRLGCDPEEVLVGAVGRLSPEKGFDQLIQAIVELRQGGKRLALWIAGDGSAQTDLQSLIDRLDCGSYVRLLGHVVDPKTFYQGMDVFVLSSIREGLPNVLLEAMALGTPVVATRIAGVPSLVHDGSDGLLVEPDNVAQLKSAIATLVDDESLRQSLAEAGRKTIEERFSFTHRMQKVATVYDGLLGVGRNS